MAFFLGNLRSETLRMETQVALLLPQDRYDGAAPCKVLYLLHGLGQNASSWQRYSGLELMLQQQNVVAVMPEVQRSFYCDMTYGSDYFTYITQELPQFVSRTIKVSQKREDTIIAGLSMGGFGALKCGLSHPELFGACASFSGSVSMPYVLDAATGRPRLENQLRAILGEEMALAPENDLLALAQKASQLPEPQRPRVFATCGSSDDMVSINREFAARMDSLPLDFTYREWEGGHNWSFWSQSFSKMLFHLLEISPECS